MNNYKDNHVLNIHIDRLVLDGMHLSLRQQQQLSEALQAALKDHFSEKGIPERIASLSSSPELPAPSIQLSKPVTEPAALGTQIASSVYQGLSTQS